MKRLLLAAVVVLVCALPAWAQTDLNVVNYPCYPPNQTTSCVRVHVDTTSSTARAGLIITGGDIVAAGGYKVAYSFAHPSSVVPNITRGALPIAGTGYASNGTAASLSAGPLYQYPGYAGSIIGISIASSQALTLNGAHCEAVVYNGNIHATGFNAYISSAITGRTQFHQNTQSRGLNTFLSTEAIGVRISTDSGIAPVNTNLSCAAVVVY